MKQMHNSKNTSSSSPRLLLHVVLLSTALCSTANAFEFPNPFANKAGGASLAIKKMNPVQSTVRASILFVRDDDDDDLSSVGGGFGFVSSCLFSTPFFVSFKIGIQFCGWRIPLILLTICLFHLLFVWSNHLQRTHKIIHKTTEGNLVGIHFGYQ